MIKNERNDKAGTALCKYASRHMFNEGNAPALHSKQVTSSGSCHEWLRYFDHLVALVSSHEVVKHVELFHKR